MHRIPGRWPVHECEWCGSGTTLPLVAESELGGFYPTDYPPFEVPSRRLARAVARMQRLRDRRFPLVTLSASKTRGTLLDVGCGRGDLAASWVAAGWRVLGIEPSPQAAASAVARGAHILGQTLSAVTLAPESLDAVVFRHSLEHLAEPRTELRRVLTALRPGGRLAVILPNWSSWQRRAFGQYWFPLELPRHRTHFTAAGLGSAISAGGFVDLEIRPATPLITTTWSLEFRLFGRPVTEQGAALLAGYAISVPVGAVAGVLDAARGGGDFLHAAARRPD
ncbi:MAG: class I SAM-dependent methyltransferase [Actinomycetota bacterium]|nr:class I SAM-dependent methyltransferase [Actinomycetota bacterium]